METVKKIANIIFWILLVTLILTVFLNNLAVMSKLYLLIFLHIE